MRWRGVVEQRVARLLTTRLDPSLTPVERRTTLERIRSELTTGWQTADNSREKLTIADEREHVLFFLVEVVYDVIPAFYEGIEDALALIREVCREQGAALLLVSHDEEVLAQFEARKDFAELNQAVKEAAR